MRRFGNPDSSQSLAPALHVSLTKREQHKPRFSMPCEWLTKDLGWVVRWTFYYHSPLTALEGMAGTTRLELASLAFLGFYNNL